MKSERELAQEYAEFETKFLNATKDIADAIQKLSPTNLAKFKRECKRMLPAGLANLIRELNR
ncbi:MAG: hypothetical protein K2K85_05515 [Clostridia bacterium]|nr:hypothetical protein [Clostridia bacterium]